MSFLTEYFDEYRTKPIRKTKMCRPELRWAKINGEWLDPKKGGSEERVWSDEEIQAFIKNTMKSLRGRSTYFNAYCAHLDPEIATRAFVPRVNELPPCDPAKVVVEEIVQPPLAPKQSFKDSEVMKMAKELYERDIDSPSLAPLDTDYRIYGYCRKNLWKTGISEYQGSVAWLAYDLVKHDRWPRFHAHNGSRPRWGLPPEGTRQPELDGLPFEGERLY